VEPLGVDEAAEAAERHGQLYFGGVAVDAVQGSDQYYRLALDSCFYVAGMGASCRAESIGAAEYMARPGRRCRRGPPPRARAPPVLSERSCLPLTADAPGNSAAGVGRPLVPASRISGIVLTVSTACMANSTRCCCWHGPSHFRGQLSDALCDLSLLRSLGRLCSDSGCAPGFHAAMLRASQLHIAVVSCSWHDPAWVPWRHSQMRLGQARPAGTVRPSRSTAGRSANLHALRIEGGPSIAQRKQIMCS